MVPITNYDSARLAGAKLAMHSLVQTVLTNHEKLALEQFIDLLRASDKRYFLRNEIQQTFIEYCEETQKPTYFFHSSPLAQLIHYTHELILEDGSIWLVLRPWVASQQVWRLSSDLAQFEQMPMRALLDVRDRWVNRYQPNILEIDFGPFYEQSPSISDPRNIGQGLTFLNHHLCEQVLTDREFWIEALFQVLRQHEYDGISLLIGDRIHSGTQLASRVREAIQFIDQRPADEPYEKFHAELQELGFDPGWGNTAFRVRETLELLEHLIHDPEPAFLEAFVSRVPAILRVVLVSVHGWVGQESVLGRPETSGQVVYVLDQARTLENTLREQISQAGLDFLNIQPHVVILTRLIPNCEGTLCSQKIEKLDDTENGWILRVPFREFNPNVTQNWISKYEIWPYLESFAQDAEKELLAILKGSPNLIIGNYSDGNLVAFLMARRLKAIHCHIAHSLEKPKRLFSNLYWQELEDEYHFSAQFAADLISMNAADFIITSSYQEIVGSPDTVGQYESYKCYSMPQLYHVIDGIDLFSPKFNRVPPGVNEAIFFPYYQKERRTASDRERVQDLLFFREDPNITGRLENLEKRPILAVAPINSTKNLTGLVECFGRSQELQHRCNLILVTNNLHEANAARADEAEEIGQLHGLIEQYQLYRHIRWVGMPLPTVDLGEIYRVIADQQGVFVHFAWFEAFGRVILEAMSSGLPTFATQFGGASEILQHYEDSFLINPTDIEGSTQKLLNFIDQCNQNPAYWQEISDGMIQRIQDEYNWKLHTRQLLLLSKLYSFWNYVYQDNREALLHYLDALFHLIYKPRAELILEQHYRR